jgi:hypothetical protein
MEWKDTADKLMNNKNNFEKWKKEMETLPVSSVNNVLQQTPVQP